VRGVNCIPCTDAQWYIYIDLTVWILLSSLFFFPLTLLINKEFKHSAAFSIKCQESATEVGKGKSVEANH